MSDPREPVALDPAKLVEATASDPGKVRPENQDALSAQKNVAGERLFVVSDGMGGQRGGETAAKLCIETLSRVFRDPHGKPEERLRRGLELANEEVYSHALSHPERKGMGATAVALLFAYGPGQTWLAWIGDSRCYRLREGALDPLTRDHSIVAEWIEMGVLNAEEAQNHPRRHELTRAIGQAPDVSVEIAAVDARPGDRFLLCSDGLHGSVPEKTLKPALAEHPPAESVRLLVERANAAGGPDNIAIVVVEVPADGAMVGEIPVPEVPLEFALPSPPPPPPTPAPEPELAEVEPPADDMFIESTSHSSAAIDAAIAELASARKGAELAPASEPDLPPELALGITGSKFEFDLSPPEERPDLATTQPFPAPAAIAPEAEPLEFAAPDPPPEPEPEPPPPPVQSMEESFADLMDGGGDSDGPLASEPLAGFATPPPESRAATAFDSPSLVATPPARRVQIPLMTPVRKRRGLHAPSVMAGIAAGAVVAVLAAAAWLYTGMGNLAPEPPPAPQIARTVPPPRPVAPPTPAPVPVPEPAPVPVPAPEPAPLEQAAPEPTPEAELAPVPVPEPAPAPAETAAEVAPAPERPPIPIPAPGPAPATTTVVIVRPSQPPPQPQPQPPAPPAAPDGAAAPTAATPKLPTSATFELTAPVHRFVDDWLRAQETHDATLFTSLGFRDLPHELAGAWTTRDTFRLVAASVDEERSSPDTLYLRLVVSYAFKDTTGRFRTQDEERLILRNTNGTLRYEGRWSK